MSSKLKITVSLLCLLLQLASPVLSSSSSFHADSDTITSDEIAPPSLSTSPLLVNSPHFIPTATLFMPENAVTSDDRVDDDEEASDTPPETTSSWNILEEVATESAPTLMPEDLVQQTQAIAIESYVVTDRKAKSELLPPSRHIKETFLPESDSSLSSLSSLDHLTVKNLTSDPEDLENALFNDTAGSSLSIEDQEQEDQSREEQASEESVVTDSAFVVKQILTAEEEPIYLTTTTTTTTTTQSSPPTHPVIPNHHRKKQPKYIKKFRASASEVLRFFMEGSYLRSPLAVLVDTSDKTLQKTKILWNATLQQSTANIDMVLVTFDHSGGWMRGDILIN